MIHLSNDSLGDTWLERELQHVNFGDKRLSKRLVDTSILIERKASGSINESCGTWKATKGAYRLLSHQKFETQKIYGSDYKETRERLKGHKFVFSLQDTTYLDFDSHVKTQGLGSISKAYTKHKKGLILHSALLVSLEGLPLGLTSQQCDFVEKVCIRRVVTNTLAWVILFCTIKGGFPMPDKSPYRVRNWKHYNRSLIQRGRVTLWFSEESLQDWYALPQPHQRGRPQEYSDQAILCLLSLKAVYHLSLRGAQGFLESLLSLLKLSLKSPHYTLVCKRQKHLKVDLPKGLSRGEGLHIVVDSTGLKVFGEGEWKVRQPWVCDKALMAQASPGNQFSNSFN